MADANEMQQFISGYLTCALWSSTDESTEAGGEPMDKTYEPEQCCNVERALADCGAFVGANIEPLGVYLNEIGEVPDGTPWERAGHDFWLTRNGHGAGFWARPNESDSPEFQEACGTLANASTDVGETNVEPVGANWWAFS